MTPHRRLRPALALSAMATLTAALCPQSDAPQDKAAAYPERDILSPFRAPSTVYAPPDAVYGELRIMRGIAERSGATSSFDAGGREICDSSEWRAAYERLQKLFIDPGYLAQIMRRSGSADDRATAFYGAFFSAEVPHVFNLISHIPGEPVAETRQRAYPRALAYLRAHFGQRYGDLTDEEKAALNLPAPGSPAAKAMGITRAPVDEDFLFTLNLKPFFQLLDLDIGQDQAQALWFLKECFRLRSDLTALWLEPALPRLRELLHSKNPRVRAEAIGLLGVIDETGQKQPSATADLEDLDTWAEKILLARFPPVRRISSGLMVLLPSEERDAIVAAGLDLLRRSEPGEVATGKMKDGQIYRGFRLAIVAEPLDRLGIPEGAVITTINGQPINDGPSLLKVLEDNVEARRALLVEYVVNGQSRAAEFRYQ